MMIGSSAKRVKSYYMYEFELQLAKARRTHTTGMSSRRRIWYYLTGAPYSYSLYEWPYSIASMH